MTCEICGEKIIPIRGNDGLTYFRHTYGYGNHKATYNFKTGKVIF